MSTRRWPSFREQHKVRKAWGVNTDAHLTTVIVKGKKVVATFAYRSTNETAVKEVVSALKAK